LDLAFGRLIKRPRLKLSNADIQTGYRLFDGAYNYSNEKEAGEGIRRAIKDGLVTREEIFVTTKLWNNYHKE
jgi:D-xylose reductase